MKILVISAEYPPFFAGGIALNVFDLNQHMNKKNDIITLSFGNNEKTLVSRRKETKIISFPMPKVDGKLSYEKKYTIQNETIINEIKNYEKELKDIGLVVLHGYFLTRVALHISKRYDVPILYYLHVIYTKKADKYLDQISLDEIALLKKSLAIVCVSNYLLNEACEVYSIYSKAAVIGKAIECEENLGKKYIMNENLYLYVGRMSREKGLEVLLEAFGKYIEKNNEKALLYCIGTFVDDEYRKEISDLCASSYKLKQHVVFLGSKDRTEIYQYMKMSNAVVIPSYMETFGKVAIEAMANKTLVIVSDVGGLGPLVVDGETGLKFEAGNIEALYGQLCRLTTINRNKIVDAGYEFVKKEFSYEHIIRKSNTFIARQLSVGNFYE